MDEHRLKSTEKNVAGSIKGVAADTNMQAAGMAKKTAGETQKCRWALKV